jgi:hypothetical protein
VISKILLAGHLDEVEEAAAGRFLPLNYAAGLPAGAFFTYSHYP